MAHHAASSGGDFTSWITTNTISMDNTTFGNTSTIQIGDWGVPTVTVRTNVAETLSKPSPMSAVERMDERLNRIRRRVAVAA